MEPRGNDFQGYLERLNAEWAEAQRTRNDELALLARQLVPREPLPDFAVEASRLGVLDAVMAATHPLPRISQAKVYRRIAAAHARMRAQAEGLTVDDPRFEAAQQAEAAWRQAAVVAKRAAAWGAHRNGPPAKRPTREPAADTRAIQELLVLVRNFTGRSQHKLLARMLTVAGRPTSAAWLRKIDRSRKIV